MPNISKISGFRPVKYQDGKPFFGAGNVYVVAAGQTVVPGDVVYSTGTANSAGVPEVTGVASALMVGPVLGVVNAKLDPITGKMTSGGITLDTPQTATAGAYILVCDSPNVVCEAEKASFAVTDVGANLDVSGSAGGSATTGVSSQLVGTTTVNASWRVIGLALRPDNETGAFAKVLVVPNAHFLKATVAAN